MPTRMHAPGVGAAPRPEGARRPALAAPLLATLLALATAGAQAQAAVKPLEGPSFTPMLLALVLVLALIGAAVWVLRRTGIAPRTSGQHLRVVTQLALGPRERVVIVEAGDRWLLLGVGSGGISRLGTMPRVATPDADAPPASFGALLERFRGAK